MTTFLEWLMTYAVIFKFSNVVCVSYNHSWFQYHECRLKAISRNKVILNINGTVLHSVNNVFVDANLYKRESGYKPWLLKGVVDCCRFMRKNYNPAAKILFGLFKEFTNINHTCPYVGPQILRGFYLRPELLLLPFPSGEYMLSLRWFFDQKLQFDTNVSFLFVEDIKKA
ncbi:uncharacterized protein LOC110186045 [Drosophila serrata]|uniref:uncharacterized protein LOC110186045 n=1 Tax=Drosophila serrata TaxID=7274 RepID=UPI000A1D1404|nr:uncharacterized protein LOC110186045 [Drosophila serrata]